jgi:hypothetical protein
MSTVETVFKNSVDFYLSFGIGIAAAIALIGIWQAISSLRASRHGGFDGGTGRARSITLIKGRGDIRTSVVILTYVLCSSFYIVLCGWLLDWDFRGSHLLAVLLFFAFIYTPLVSYVTARLEGMAGMALELPYLRETALILSGFKGIEIWLLPIPMRNYGGEDLVNYRLAELVGCSFRSLWKMTAFTVPLVFVLSLIYGQFIWSLGPIPSGQYPYASQLWELNARNYCLIYSSTVSGYSPFSDAIVPGYIAAGGAVAMMAYAGLSALGLPVMLLYGVVKGLGGGIPQALVTQCAGALFGRYVMTPRFGEERWLNYSMVLAAGYSCGAGLIMMFASGIRFLSASVFQLNF